MKFSPMAKTIFNNLYDQSDDNEDADDEDDEFFDDEDNDNDVDDNGDNDESSLHEAIYIHESECKASEKRVGALL